LPNFILEITLDLIEETWIELQCCFGTVYLPVEVLARRHGGECLLGEVMARLRCQKCHEVPAGFALVDAPGRAGSAPYWRVPLDRRTALSLSLQNGDVQRCADSAFH